MSLQHVDGRIFHPGGKRVQYTITATAGNVVTNISPATGKRWLGLRGILTLTTDATVANRTIVLQITDGTNLIECVGYSAVIAASLVGSLSFGEVVHAGGKAAAIAGIFTDNINSYLGIRPILIEGADQLRITIINGKAGDSYSGYLVVLEL